MIMPSWRGAAVGGKLKRPVEVLLNIGCPRAAAHQPIMV
jgi:hypothetical protein